MSKASMIRVAQVTLLFLVLSHALSAKILTFEENKKLAEAGDADAQLALVDLYLLRDQSEEATKWLKKAVEQGNAYAQYRMGNLYANGLMGFLKDDKEAVKWYIKAAEQGDTDAQHRLAIGYYFGEGVLEDKKEAVKLFRKAAEQGHKASQYCLGFAYDNGIGVLEDDRESTKWYRKAAEQGEALAQHNLAIAYSYGRGVPEDYIVAYAWVNLAGANGMDVKSTREIFKRELTSDQIADAQKLSREMLAANPKLISE